MHPAKQSFLKSKELKIKHSHFLVMRHYNTILNLKSVVDNFYAYLIYAMYAHKVR